MSTVDATSYLTVEGTRNRYSYSGQTKSIVGAKVVRVTQGKPASLAADQVAVKVTIRMPAGAFDPLEPAALIVVPEDMIQHAVEVEAIND